MAKRETKAERLAREAAEHEAELHAALSWPDRPKPEPYTAEAMKQMTAHLGYAERDVVRAWTYNAYSKRVTHGCFGNYGHSDDGERASSRGKGGPWFSNATDAHLALEWAVCRLAAREILSLRSWRPSVLSAVGGKP